MIIINTYKDNREYLKYNNTIYICISLKLLNFFFVYEDIFYMYIHYIILLTLH